MLVNVVGDPQVRGVAAALSPVQYPLLAETVKHASDVPPEQEFGQGLDIVLSGLRTILSQRN